MIFEIQVGGRRCGCMDYIIGIRIAWFSEIP